MEVPQKISATSILEMYRTQGIIHTIKDGVVFENKNLMREVERIVKESKKDAGPDIVTEPFK